MNRNPMFFYGDKIWHFFDKKKGGKINIFSSANKLFCYFFGKNLPNSWSHKIGKTKPYSKVLLLLLLFPFEIQFFVWERPDSWMGLINHEFEPFF